MLAKLHRCAVDKLAEIAVVVVGSCVATAAAAETPAAAIDATAPSANVASTSVQVPTYVDTVERGLRLRVDLGGRFAAIGLPSPPVRLQLDEPGTIDGKDVPQNGKPVERNDVDVTGVVLFGWDRPFGTPIMADVFGVATYDIGGDQATSPFLDDNSNAFRARLYSAFIGLSPNNGEPWLKPFRLNLGRMTEIVESPVTYDGASASARFDFGGFGIGARVWGGLDAPQRLANDPFSRIDNKAYKEAYKANPAFLTDTGAFITERVVNNTPTLNVVAGGSIDAKLLGVALVLSHAVLPVAQRSRLDGSYTFNSDFLLWRVAANLKATDFIPRATGIATDLLSGDGTTRVGLTVNWQFAADVVAYDGTFRAFPFSNVFALQTADQIEQFRQRDGIRHLNFTPPQENITALLDAERQLPWHFAVQGRVRVRQYFDANDVDLFNSNIYEAGVGGTWSPGMALTLGTEVLGGIVDTGKPDQLTLDLRAEGVQNFVTGRLFGRLGLFDGRLSNLSEVFVRRQDLTTRVFDATGQWSTALATTTRYNIFDFWAVSLRMDADVLAPFAATTGSGYVSALLATSVRL